jgi:lysophospholipase L1-like esterase
MKVVLFIVGAILISYIAYDVARVSSLLSASRTLVRQAMPFARDKGALHLLVLGDSTAVGVGSEPADSVPGRLGMYINSSVENRAHSGATAEDVIRQLNGARRTSYDMILIQVGANDVMRFRSLQKTEESLDAALSAAEERSARIVLLTAGKIGDAPFFPRIVRSIMNSRTEELRERFMRASAAHNVVYVDIFSRESPFEDDPERYYASDKLHPSGEGYGFWFSIVREYVDERWPEFRRWRS